MDLVEDIKTQGSVGISAAVNQGDVGIPPGNVPPPPPITKSSKMVNPGLLVATRVVATTHLGILVQMLLRPSECT